MIAHGKEIKVFCGNSNPTFAQGVCDELGVNLGRSEVKKFADGEVSVSVNETVRGLMRSAGLLPDGSQR